MDRRKFFKAGSLLVAGGALLKPTDLLASTGDFDSLYLGKKAQNIIFMISDGMSTGTLNMADLYLNRITGKGSNWMQLYKDNKVTRALMDTASANSIVTDSAASSSAFGGGFRVKNGVLNVGENKERHLPIWQKFKQKGKKTGCVTTVTATHATPAGFCVNSDSRSAEPTIALDYLKIGMDVVMGGGDEFFNAEKRKDKQDVYGLFREKKYQVLKNRNDLKNAKNDQPVLGIFSTGALPYTIDRNYDESLKKETPTLAEMSQLAIDNLKGHEQGFVLQIEGGKVDWAAHANDISALIHDQIAFDEAIKVAIDFAEKDKNTLVIITTDHGNANPGVIYGKNANTNFDSLAKYTHTNEWVLNQIKAETTSLQVKELIQSVHGITLNDEQAGKILSYYTNLDKENGLYNYKKLPFKSYSEIQKEFNSVGWISMDHSADYVELAAYGPGSELIKPFMINTELHYLMLEAAHVENKF